jgi:hypothetical protein
MIQRRISLCILLLLVSPLSIRAQQAVTTRNAILRRDPSTASPAVGHLPKGTGVTLVEQNLDNGYHHISTKDQQIGWVSSKALNISQASRPPAPSTPVTPAPPRDTTCDANLQGHVYNPARLIVKQACIAVTGTIVDATAGKAQSGVRREKDGDAHGWLKLDSGFQNLLNAGNRSAAGGNLVFEIVCKFPVTQTSARSACQGYRDHVTLAPVGSHVRIVGTYVQDTFHAQWMEIHPVSSITVIP